MVLVGIAYHETKRYCLDHLMDWIRDADLPDSDVVIRVHRGTYGENGGTKNQREFFRRLAVERGASHLFLVGADTIPPQNALKTLLSRNKDVVGGLYYYRLPEGGEAVAWRENDPDKSFLTEPSPVLVDGMGMDCVLFSRKAFGAVSWTEWPEVDDDYPYYNRLKQRGFEIWLDHSVVCRHYYAADGYA